MGYTALVPFLKSARLTVLFTDDETNMDELVANVKAIEMDGLVWGAHKLEDVGYGIKKLHTILVVEDEKVSIEELQQKIEEDDEHVQSTDVVSPLSPPFTMCDTKIWNLTGCYAKAVMKTRCTPFS